jgi:hypothetical protein
MRFPAPLSSLLCVVCLASCRIEKAPSGRPAGEPTEADSLARVEQDSALQAGVSAALRLYYGRLSDRDWRAFRRSFWPGATIATRWTPPGERRERVWVQTVDEFARRAPQGPGRMAVFGERMLHAHVTGYGDLANAWVIYEGRWGERRDSVRTVRGIDAFTLYRDGGEWRIASLVFTPEVPGRPLEAQPPRRARRPTSAAGSR